ncbi:hypothetical protein [Myceligenerans salitolerans]|uniref:Transcriptional regulator n=1 Tax=Myceligenerans salitolerans TaxID=1230528 RepID=A0ABS3I469_9MICO|nr:hypothetical protein [Myceligenerans salitolerans]MBO0607792.1 hypothetical protein [Myceligenerans salitolerans]
MSRRELAEAVNQYLWRTTGKEVHLDVDTLRRYENGQPRWPGADYRDGLRAVLGVGSDADLGFHPTRRGRTAAPTHDVGAWIATWAHKDAVASADSEIPATAIDLLCRAVLSYPPAEGGLDRLERARPAVAGAFASYQAGSFEAAALRASKALAALRSAEHGRATTDARVRALAYQVAAIVLSKAGRTDIAWIAADRGVAAAEASNDACLRLSLLRTAAFSMAAAGHRGDALVTIKTATREFQGRMSRTMTSAAVYGTILLTGAVLLAGAGDQKAAATYLDEAQRAAMVTDTDRNDLWTAFGPTNVAIHRANVAAAAGDMDTVLAVGGPLRVEHLPAERRVRLHLDVARASLAAGDHGDALATLVRAEAAAPSQVRHHHITKDVVTSLITEAVRRPGPELTRLAGLVGVPTT